MIVLNLNNYCKKNSQKWGWHPNLSVVSISALSPRNMSFSMVEVFELPQPKSIPIPNSITIEFNHKICRWIKKSFGNATTNLYIKNYNKTNSTLLKTREKQNLNTLSASLMTPHCSQQNKNIQNSTTGS